MRNFVAYAGLASAGLVFDFCIYYILLLIGLQVMFANLISGMVAALLVFSVSSILLFKQRQRFHHLVIVALYQLLSIPLFSFFVGFAQISFSEVFSSTLWSGLAAKFLVLPLSFTANYLFSRTLASLKFSSVLRNKCAKLSKKKNA